MTGCFPASVSFFTAPRRFYSFILYIIHIVPLYKCICFLDMRIFRAIFYNFMLFYPLQ